MFFENFRVLFENVLKFRSSYFDIVLVNLQLLRNIKESGTWRDVFGCRHSNELTFFAESRWKFNARVQNTVLVAPLFESCVLG